jgi:hypothetical protein
MASDDEICVGRQVADRYRLESKIGSGGHGEVWQGTDLRLHRSVALKCLLDDDLPPGMTAAEARRLAQSVHANVVTVHDVVVDSGRFWLVMEFISGGSLADLHRISPDQAVRYAALLANVLVVLRRKKMVHCDIKPSNVLLTEDDQPKLGDFGISQQFDGAATVTTAGHVVGTLDYMAPEVAGGQQPSPAADVFSLGATLYDLLEGCSPYGEVFSLNDVRRAAGNIPAPRRAGTLTPLLTRMLHRDPVDRPTATELVAELARLSGKRQRFPTKRIMVIGAAVVLAAGVTIGLPMVLAHGTSTLPGPTLTMSDPRSVDPCGLDRTAPLTRFGSTRTSTDYGNFNRCDVLVHTATGQVDVEAQLQTEAEAEGVPQGTVSHPGNLTVVAEPLDDGECDRAVVLPDHDQVDLTASTDDDGQSTANLCPLVDAATTAAVHTLTTAGLPRRTVQPPTWSWFYANACAALDPAALDRFPGVDALHPEVGLGNWECVWNSTTSSAYLRVRFDRGGPLTAADGTPVRLAGHSAFVSPNGYGDGSCEVDVEGHSYTDQDAQPTVEQLLVVITGPQPMTQLCDQTQAIAGSAAAKLSS